MGLPEISRTPFRPSPNVADPLLAFVVCEVHEDVIRVPTDLDPRRLQDVVDHVLEGHLADVSRVEITDVHTAGGTSGSNWLIGLEQERIWCFVSYNKTHSLQ